LNLSICWIFIMALSEFLGGDLLIGGIILTFTLILFSLFSFIFSIGYKKEYGRGLFDINSDKLTIPLVKKSKDIFINNQLEKINIDPNTTIKFKPQRKMGKTSFWIILILALAGITIFLINSEIAMPFRVAIICIGLILYGNLSSSRLDFSPDLKAYAKTSLIGNIVRKSKWYELPEIANILIKKKISSKSVVMFPVKMGAYKTTDYHLVLTFVNTKDQLYLTTTETSEKATDLKDLYLSKIKNA
jgi:hypothetical protein